MTDAYLIEQLLWLVEAQLKLIDNQADDLKASSGLAHHYRMECERLMNLAIQ